ncbi:MAG TPA: ABC transporter ATP-binding protein [Dongiaceae bacterium]|nr:ABC transporter ATP-binding protein [Dongiaceae bacterium]
MEPNLFKYILKHSFRDQILILIVVAISLVFYYVSLDLPKTIVNAIQHLAGHPDKITTFLHLEFGVPAFLGGGTVVLFDGFRLGREAYLIAICVLFLIFVIINNWFKIYINTAKGRMGERMLRRLRYDLFDRVLRFPQSQFRKVKQAEIATMIKDEVEPLGGFIGDAFVQPAFLGGNALTALYFMLQQSFWLGGVAVIVLLVQAVVIPRLRKKILVLGKQRQLTARALAGRIAECVDGSVEIHTNDTSNYERADIVDRLGRIYQIRFDLYQRKFAVKGLNNFLAQVTPFTFYLLGGLLAFAGRVDLGIIVAVINAYKDLPGPVKELIDWDQQRQDVQIKYEQVAEQFEPEGMLAEELAALPKEPVAPLSGDIALSTVIVADDNGVKLLDSVSATIPDGTQVAVIGEAGSGVETLSLVLARIMPLTAGSIAIGGRDLASMPEAATGRNVGYAGPESYMFPLSVRENIIYGLKHAPQQPAVYDDAGKRARDSFDRETRRAGNPVIDIAADWIDYESAGATNMASLDDRIIETLKIVEFEDDVYQFGLRGTIDPAAQSELAAKFITARADLRQRLADPALATLVEPFDVDRYNKNMSVVENLLFGQPVGLELQPDRIARNPYLLKVLADAGLAETLADVGRRIAETMVELFADLPPGHPFFEQFSFISAEDLPEYRALLGRLGKASVATLPPEDHMRLTALAFPYVEARHRLDLIDAALEARLLEARRAFAQGLPAELKSAVEFYEIDRYIGAASVQDNVLFGRLVYGQAQAASRIGKLIGEVLDTLDLRRSVLRIGLEYQAGIAGKRLSQIQRQKLGLTRALLKRPRYLIVNEATALIDGAGQVRILENILKASEGRTVLWVLRQPKDAERFQRLITMKDGRIGEQGSPKELLARKAKAAEGIAAQ